MIYSFSRKVFQVILVISIVCTGSFVLQEEASEKTEKTEKAEEALHSSFHAKGFKKVTNSIKSSNTCFLLSPHLNKIQQVQDDLKDDFNIYHIYVSSNSI